MGRLRPQSEPPGAPPASGPQRFARAPSKARRGAALPGVGSTLIQPIRRSKIWEGFKYMMFEIQAATAITTMTFTGSPPSNPIFSHHLEG